MIWECFCWCYDPKSSKNMFLGETNTKLKFYSLKFEIYSFRFGILENQFFQNISPHFYFCSLKIAPFDSSRKSDRFSRFKLQKISKGGKVTWIFLKSIKCPIKSDFTSWYFTREIYISYNTNFELSVRACVRASVRPQNPCTEF